MSCHPVRNPKSEDLLDNSANTNTKNNQEAIENIICSIHEKAQAGLKSKDRFDFQIETLKTAASDDKLVRTILI